MRIVVNDIAASARGALLILYSLYEYIKEHDRENDWFFLLSDRYIEEKENIHVFLFPKVKQSRIERLKFDFLYGRKMIADIAPDVVFYLQNTLIHGVKFRQVLYMDQPIPFQNSYMFSLFKKEEREYAVYQHLIGFLIKNACKKSDRVIVQTRWTKREVIRKCRIGEERVRIISPQIVNDGIEPTDQYMQSEFVYPASPALYKNHKCIQLAIEKISVAEKENLKIYYTLDPDPTLANRHVVFLGEKDHKSLMSFMSQRTLIFPSYIESYGLPLAEARHLETIVLAADTEFSREILDGYPNAYFFDPFQPDELKGLILDVLSRRIRRCRELPRRGSVHAAASTWEEVIQVLGE